MLGLSHGAGDVLPIIGNDFQVCFSPPFPSPKYGVNIRLIVCCFFSPTVKKKNLRCKRSVYAGAVDKDVHTRLKELNMGILGCTLHMKTIGKHLKWILFFYSSGNCSSNPDTKGCLSIITCRPSFLVLNHKLIRQKHESGLSEAG